MSTDSSPSTDSTSLPTVRVALLWHDRGATNLGVQALTAAHLGMLDRAAARAGVTLDLVWAGNDTLGKGEHHSVSLGNLPHEALGKGRLTEALRGCDLALDIGEGDSFADIYGARRLTRVIGLRSVVQRLGIPVVMAPQTVGPFTTPVGRRWARFALNHAEHVWTRDLESFGAVRAIAPKAKASLASDVALRLAYDPPAPREPGPARLGLVPSGLLASGKGLSLKLATDYPAMLDKLVPRLAELGEVHLVAHVLSNDSHDADDELCEQLAARFPGCVVAPTFTTASEAKTYLAGLDVVLSSRMHACVGALSSGVPTLPLAYSPKFFGLFASLGYDALVDLRSTQTDDAVTRSLAFVQERAAWQVRAAEALAVAQSRLDAYEDFLVTTLTRG
jgi:colanic acid/amylovoran biosynthesis protein